MEYSVKRWCSSYDTIQQMPKSEFTKGNLKALVEFYRGTPTEPIRCAECNTIITLSIREIKANCLYQTSNPYNCLCPTCTKKWYNFMRPTKIACEILGDYLI